MKHKKYGWMGRFEQISPMRIAAGAIIILLLAASIIFLTPSISRRISSDSIDNTIVFLKSDRCAQCEATELEVRDIACEFGIKFYSMNYDEPGYAPSLLFMHNNAIFITGYKDAQSLAQQICGFMESKKACRKAGEIWQ